MPSLDSQRSDSEETKVQELGSDEKQDDVEIHTWNGPNDPDNPYATFHSSVLQLANPDFRFNFSFTYKWVLTVTVCFISILTGLPAGSYGAGNDWMGPLWHVQNEPFPNLYWATCSWNLGAAIWPLLFVPLTENTGRMPGYFVRSLFRPFRSIAIH